MNAVKNISILFASSMIENFVRHGINQFFLAPGSRNSAFLYSIIKNPRASYCMHFDERGLGFLGLGYSKRSLKPAVLCVTSGTALANLYPAILEASYSKIPLLILSADRSFEELYNHSDQSMDQHHLYSAGLIKYFYHPSPLPTSSLAHSLSLSSQIAHHLEKNEIVHLNMSFKKPFDPHVATAISEENLLLYEEWMKKETPYTQISSSNKISREVNLSDLKEPLDSVFFILGKMHPKKEASLSKLLSSASMPFFSEISSSGKSFKPYFALYACHLKKKPSVIIHLGQKLISPSVKGFMRSSSKEGSLIIHVCSDFLVDPEAIVNWSFQEDEINFTESLLKTKHPTPWSFRSPDETIEQFLEKEFQCHYSELSVFRSLWKSLPQESLAFIANSMPIRHHLLYASKQEGVEVFSNRGLSGIDGIIATFCGLLKAKQIFKKAVLILGDLSFLHDLNSLSLFSKTKNTLLLLINNGGGAIFKYLPISGIDKETFDEAFFTPHQQNNFLSIAKQFGLNYETIASLEELEKISSIIEKETPTLLEVFVDANETQALEETIKNKIKELL